MVVDIRERQDAKPFFATLQAFLKDFGEGAVGRCCVLVPAAKAVALNERHVTKISTIVKQVLKKRFFTAQLLPLAARQKRQKVSTEIFTFSTIN